MVFVIPEFCGEHGGRAEREDSCTTDSRALACDGETGRFAKPTMCNVFEAAGEMRGGESRRIFAGRIEYGNPYVIYMAQSPPHL